MSHFKRACQMSSVLAGLALSLGACSPEGSGPNYTTSTVGPRGEPGEPGRAGPTGPTGLIGPRGAQGDVGPRGPHGPRGYGGGPGAPGEDGREGAAGPMGLDGAPGPRGLDGPRGPQGLQGPQGPQGPRGVQGPLGPAGDDGASGAPGPEGAKGPPGIAGEQGPAGQVGLPGPAGAAGSVGPPGLAGNDGPDGPVGADGADGADGPSGPVGEAGAPGAAGPSCAGGDVNNDGVEDARDCVAPLLALRCDDRQQPQFADGEWTCRASNVGARRGRAGFTEEFVSTPMAALWVGTNTYPTASMFDGRGGVVVGAFEQWPTGELLYKLQEPTDASALDLEASLSGVFPGKIGTSLGFYGPTGVPVATVSFDGTSWSAQCRRDGAEDGAQSVTEALATTFNRFVISFDATQQLINFRLDDKGASLDCGSTFVISSFGIMAPFTGVSGPLTLVDLATWRLGR